MPSTMTEPPRFSKFRPHPWHGLEAGDGAPERVTAYIEITPFDLVKYEIDKESGYLKLDRPQLTSSLPPALYGFIPQTFCGEGVAARSTDTEEGDEDPLDICVVTGRPVGRSGMIVSARVLGVIRTTDSGRADDKIVSVLDSDPLYGTAKDLSDLPRAVVDSLLHYFTTYKQESGKENPMVVHGEAGRDEACELVRASMNDYGKMIGAHGA